VETALLAVEGTEPHYQIRLRREGNLDHMIVEVEVTPEVFSDKVRALEDVRKKLTSSIEHVCGIHVTVTLVEPNTIERSQGKAKRVIDERKL